MAGWRRPWLTLLLALACVVGGDTGVWAEERGTRVAIIEMARILNETSAIRSIQVQGEAQRRAYTEEAQREAGRLRGIRDELIRQETVLTPAAMDERQRAFNAEVAAADEKATMRSQLLQRAVTEGEIRFREALDIVVAEVAQRQAIDIVLPVHEMLFAVAEFDLTDQVIARLNEAFPEIPLAFDEG